MDLSPLREFVAEEGLLTLLVDATDGRHDLVVNPPPTSGAYRSLSAAPGRRVAVYVERRALVLAVDPAVARQLQEVTRLRVVAANATTWQVKVPASRLEDADLRERVIGAVMHAFDRSSTGPVLDQPAVAEDVEVEDVDLPAVPEITVPAVLLRINQKYQRGMDEDALYDVTHGWWKMGVKREQVDYAFAVAQGEIRGVFRVLGWRPRREGDREWEHDQPGKPRWGFDGEPAPELSHLLGLDVRALFHKGSANPVRYVNCDGPVPARVARAVTQPPPATVPLDELERVCDALHANPVLHLSLHSKELFHSNTLGWLVEAYPDLAVSVLEEWLVPDPDQALLRVRREHHNLDLVIELPGYRPLVVENKTFSLPDEHQLQRYDERNIPAAGLSGATRVLLSLPEPGWTERNGWRWISYTDLADRLALLVEPLRERDDFAGQLLEHYIQMIRDLLVVVELTQVREDSEPVQLDGDRVATLRPVRLHDVMQKLRARRLARRLESVYADAGLRGTTTTSALYNGMVLIDTKVELSNGDTLGWQLQGGQWRRFVLLPALAGRGAQAKDRRARRADEEYPKWFDFTSEQELGPFQEGPAQGYNHYDPDFVYRYVKVPGLTVGELVHLARTVTAQAVEWAQEQLGAVNSGQPRATA